jgi:hypothetical protein
MTARPPVCCLVCGSPVRWLGDVHTPVESWSRPQIQWGIVRLTRLGVPT